MKQANGTGKLHASVKTNGPVCVGLDTLVGFLPRFIQDKALSDGEKIFAFNRSVIDATYDVAACFKVQIACYEALGIDGMKAYANTVQYARSKGKLVIADVKRGDIASTAQQYAKAHFEGDFEVDCITVNAYMGEDAVSPYYDYLDNGKGIFVLVKTSNPSGKDIEDLLSGDRTIYQHMAALCSKWGEKFIDESGYSAIGAVTGLTFPAEFEGIRELMPNTFLLIPGYGAQGGKAEEMAVFFKDGMRGVVNSSRALLTAHKGKSEGEDFAQYTRNAVINMRDDILAAIQN